MSVLIQRDPFSVSSVQPIRIFVAALILLGASLTLNAQVSGGNAAQRIQSLYPSVLLRFDKGQKLIGVDLSKVERCSDELLGLLGGCTTAESVTLSGDWDHSKLISLLKQLPSLKSLRLDRSNANDAFMKELCSTLKLEEIGLDSCPVSGVSIHSMAQCTSLRRVRLSRTSIQDTDLEMLKSLPNLELLDFGGCASLTADGAEHLGKLNQLKSLTLWPHCNGKTLDWIATLPNLIILSVPNCEWSNSDLSRLASLSKLKELELSNVALSRENLVAISELKQLTKLKLKNNSLTANPFPDEFVQLKKLKSIEVSESSIHDTALQILAKLESLEDLNILRTAITNQGLTHLESTKLKRLNLDDIRSIDDSAMQSISKLDQLEFLHLGKTKITDKTIDFLVESPTVLPRLNDLIINQTAVSQVSVEKLKGVRPSLRVRSN